MGIQHDGQYHRIASFQVGDVGWGTRVDALVETYASKAERDAGAPPLSARTVSVPIAAGATTAQAYRAVKAEIFPGGKDLKGKDAAPDFAAIEAAEALARVKARAEARAEQQAVAEGRAAEQAAMFAQLHDLLVRQAAADESAN